LALALAARIAAANIQPCGQEQFTFSKCNCSNRQADEKLYMNPAIITFAKIKNFRGFVKNLTIFHEHL
jgi:hypothetical protein